MGLSAVMDDAEVRVRGIEALNKTLGPVVALRFLSLLHREPTDYVEISRRLYEGPHYPTRVGILTRAKTARIRESQAAGAMRLR